MGKYAAIGRIRLEEALPFERYEKIQENVSNDELILQDARKHNAILITADKHMKGIAQAKNIFTIWID